MKTLLLMFAGILITATASVSSACQTTAQVKQSYYYCMSFLKFSKAKQVQHAKNAGIPVDTVRWACKRQKQKGLSHMLRNNRLMCGGGGGGGGSNGGSNSSRVTCYSEERCNGIPQPAPWGPRGCSMSYKSYKDSSGRCHSL